MRQTSQGAHSPSTDSRNKFEDRRNKLFAELDTSMVPIFGFPEVASCQRGMVLEDAVDPSNPLGHSR
jgi:hypothetical protein